MSTTALDSFNMQKIEIKRFRPYMLDDMFQVFEDSFSDYSVPFKLTKEQFVRKFVQKLRLDFDLSLGAFDEDYLVGFVFSAVNMYEGSLAAYNGGTGVRPSYRGNEITQKIYDVLLPKLEEKKINKCVLEVLVENEKAIKVYQKIGFEITKFFHCFKLDAKKFNPNVNNASVTIIEVREPDWFVYEQFIDIRPSFLDSRQMVNQNLDNEKVIEARMDRKCVGYAIFQPRIGRISHVSVSAEMRGKKIGEMLIAHAFEVSQSKSLTVVNINKEAEPVVKFLKRVGFENQLDQYEMMLKL